MDRSTAEALDREDPLAGFRDEFVIDEAGPIYMDGNSLGRLSHRVDEALREGTRRWGSQLVGGWNDWIDLPTSVGDLVGGLIGAAPGQVLVGDSTTVNLYKLAVAAMQLQTGRSVIVCDEHEFPTDRYVLEGIPGAEVRQIQSDPVQGVNIDHLMSAVDERTALVCLSHVNYRSAARLDIAEVTSAVHGSGALMLWDLCHSVGAVPVELDAAGADLAVGCTYKYLNAGPGAPSFLYVNGALQAKMRSPISGWFAQRDQFGMGPRFDPVEGVGRFAAGSPPVLGLIAVSTSVSLILEAGVDRLWAKSESMTKLLADSIEEEMAGLAVRLASPADPGRRGAHVSIGHPDAWRLCAALIDRGLVVPDFRMPDVVRLGPAPIYTRYVDVFDAVDRIAGLLVSGDFTGQPAPKRTVT